MISPSVLWICTRIDSIEELHLTWDKGMLFLTRINTPPHACPSIFCTHNSQQWKLLNLEWNHLNVVQCHTVNLYYYVPAAYLWFIYMCQLSGNKNLQGNLDYNETSLTERTRKRWFAATYQWLDLLLAKRHKTNIDTDNCDEHSINSNDQSTEVSPAIIEFIIPITQSCITQWHSQTIAKGDGRKHILMHTL